MQTYYKQLSGEFERELAEVREIITAESAFLRGYGIDNAPFAAGKLLRPILCFCSQNRLSPSTIAYAAAIETVHNASLIHDDIIDRSQTRRLLPSLQQACGRETAILAGDALMGAAFRLCITACGSEKTLALSNAVNAMCEAELRQQLAIKEKRFSAEESLDVIRGKTGALFKACAEGCGNDVMDAAELCGMAFQIANDIAGIEADLRNGLHTLPVLLSNAPARANELLDKAQALAGTHEKLALFIPLIREMLVC